MSRFYNLIKVFAAGFVGAILALALLPRLAEFGSPGAAAIFGKIFKPETVVTKIEKETIVVPQPDLFFEAIKQAEPRVVAIQSFSGGKLVRSGSGLVLTNDGLIVTLNSLVPANALPIQVVGGGKIYQAEVVYRDWSKNLVLLSIPNSGLKVASLNTNLPGLSQRLLLFYKIFNLNKEYQSVQDVLVSRVSGPGTAFDVITDYNLMAYGSAMINSEGKILGIMDFKNQKPAPVFSETLGKTLDAYLTREERL